MSRRGKTDRSPTDIDIRVGSMIRELRQQRGLTLAELASHAGISHQQLQKYETGTNRLSVGMLVTLSDALGAPTSAFFVADDTQPSKRKSAVDAQRQKCEAIIRRTGSPQKLEQMFKVLRALEDG